MIALKKYTITYRCRFKEQCYVSAKYRKINTNNKLIIDGVCSRGCETADSVEYVWKVYYAHHFTDNTFWYEYEDLDGDIIGKKLRN